MVSYLTKSFSGVQFKRSQIKALSNGRIPGQGVDGYGSKIQTSYMAKVNGKWRRVYCIQHSNVGSLYVLVNKKKYFVSDADINC
jgi:hypothetical protein